MRVSTSQIYSIANVGMAQAQSAMIKTQEQISTGKRVLTPADDPVAATKILQLTREEARTVQFEKNIDVAENDLELEEVALGSITNLSQRMKELAVRAGNTAVLTPDDYRALAAEVDSRMSELLSLQNTRNASGQYIFAGYQGDTQPFASGGTGYFTYVGDEGQLHIQASGSVSVAVSDSGQRLFEDIDSGHNTFYTRASESNTSNPAATISVGTIVTQGEFDTIFPDDLVVTFNAYSDSINNVANYTVTQESTGKVLVANAEYSPSVDIEVAGISFAINGDPQQGLPATAATIPAVFGVAFDFSATQGSVTLTVGAQSETLTLDQPVTNMAELVAAFNSTTETIVGSEASQNAEKLAALGLTFDATGFTSPNGWNITIEQGDANIDAITTLTTIGAGTTSADGIVGVAGDSFSITSTDKQGLMTTLARFSEAMKNIENTAESKAALADVVAKTLTNLDNAMTSVISVQSEVGARLNTLESSRELNADNLLFTREVLSKLQDLDYAEAATRLEMESFVLTAAQQSFAKVSQLTLFNFI